jgi:Ni,Fe-hydrogenase III large subunit/Ni,Fe-hydrogenase III component G
MIVVAERDFVALCQDKWQGHVPAALDSDARVCRLHCERDNLIGVCQWVSDELGFSFATQIVDEQADGWLLRYVFYKNSSVPWAHVELHLPTRVIHVPSLSGLAHGPAIDWHEREAKDLFGLTFEGHPRLGRFVLHEDWPEGVSPMRRNFDAHPSSMHRELDPQWEPPTIVSAPGAFAMPIGPIFSDFAESAHFLLETVGEDVIRTISRFFYKYRGVEKIAEGQAVDSVLLLAERFSGTSAFAHGLAFCQAVEAICKIVVPPRALALRTVFAELERLRHHAAVIAGICHSTALAVAASQAALIEEELLRLSCEVAGHRYLFGLVKSGGVSSDLSDHMAKRLAEGTARAATQLNGLHQMLRYSSSFLDRLEEVGIVSHDRALAYGLVGPIARAAGISADMRKLFPYAAYDSLDFAPPIEQEGDGYARLRVLFREAEQSAVMIRHLLSALPTGPVSTPSAAWRDGASLSVVEAPHGAAFHWVRLTEDGTVGRYRITPPSFANWHGFHLAAESFAFQDFPIILASFGLSNAECDR